ncbi:Polynucleotide adenylyltransferase region [Paenibacillus curdlanolyticus YK9]|uniref:Polynucleotide adenylyltransferase region n=1 Tax=Paenibacillus curdlanolyticus YK9 TaxID=717606 RepID=E0IC51_9BACL|nr:CCA tRNA nucleotidyltransferase [Paenibacillus curdlanolyticus]EFM09737.1 Polynucleotide adenylyltransferase region [Paenibacillus curdlanolyticus YK9]
MNHTNPYWGDEMEAALPVLHTLEHAGYEAVFVGGCVRDVIAGRSITDIDIATAALPDVVMSLFERTVPTGLQHGTVTVIVDERTYEVTTYRSEADYEDYRRPTDVAFIAELEGDLLRRDFTINAMALRSNGTLVDPYGGLTDLRRGRIRCVGQAEERFREDALRMVRAVRFASTFGYAIAPSAWRALLRNRELLRYVAMERIGAELDKMIGGAGPHRAAALLAASGLLARAKEPLPAGFAKPDCGYRQRPALRSGRGAGGADGVPPLTAALARLQSKDDRWAGVFLALRLSPEDAEETLQRLRFPGRRIASARSVVMLHAAAAPLAAASGAAAVPLAAAAWVDAVLAAGVETASAWLRITRAFAASDGQIGGLTLSSGALEQLAAQLAQMPCTAVRELAVNGSLLCAHLGMKPGPRTGSLLQQLLRSVALGETPNGRAALLALAEILEEER